MFFLYIYRPLYNTPEFVLRFEWSVTHYIFLPNFWLSLLPIGNIELLK